MKLLLTLLTVLFVALKLCHVIDWSWWLVFTPVLSGVLLAIVLATIVVVCDTRTPLQRSLDEMSAGLRRERLGAR